MHSFAYDDLNRLMTKDVPNISPDDQDSTYDYDLLGRLTHAAINVTNQVYLTYDALGRLSGESNYFYSLAHQYDLAGRRTRLTWNDGFYINYDHLVTGEISAIRENGATSGIGVLGTYFYDDLGRRTALTRGNGTSTSYSYDGVSRLSGFAHDLSGSSYDTSSSFSYNPASQIAASTRSNDAYSYSLVTQDLLEAPNGLNQLVTQGGTSIGYDGRGNVASIGGGAYSYTSDNSLTAAPGVAAVYRDALGWTDYISTATTASAFGLDGPSIVSEYNFNAGGVLTGRYVPGPATDEYLLVYDGSGGRHWYAQDERNSAIALTDDTGTVTSINKYDDYGVPASGNVGRIGYTGQLWLSELGMYSYKSRIYAPGLGRFMQTDPIGIVGGINLYAYVGGDPINLVDPLGTVSFCSFQPVKGSSVFDNAGTNIVTAGYLQFDCGGSDRLDGPSLDNERREGGDGTGVPATPSEQKPPKRICTALQRQAQRASDFYAASASLQTKVATAGFFSGNVLARGPFKPLAGPAYLIASAATAGATKDSALASLADIASGAETRGVVALATDRLLNLLKLPGIATEQAGSSIATSAQASRCE